jgi:hypothetical protein
MATFNCKIQTAHPESVARSVYLAIGYYEIAVVVSGKGIIASAKVAAFHREVIAEAGVQSVVSGPNGNTFNHSLGTMPAIDGPVGRIFDRDSPDLNFPAIDQPDAMRAAKSFFTFRIVTINSVNDTFALNGNI